MLRCENTLSSAGTPQRRGDGGLIFGQGGLQWRHPLRIRGVLESAPADTNASTA